MLFFSLLRSSMKKLRNTHLIKTFYRRFLLVICSFIVTTSSVVYPILPSSKRSSEHSALYNKHTPTRTGSCFREGDDANQEAQSEEFIVTDPAELTSPQDVASPTENDQQIEQGSDQLNPEADDVSIEDVQTPEEQEVMPDDEGETMTPEQFESLINFLQQLEALQGVDDDEAEGEPVTTDENEDDATKPSEQNDGEELPQALSDGYDWGEAGAQGGDESLQFKARDYLKLLRPLMLAALATHRKGYETYAYHMNYEHVDDGGNEEKNKKKASENFGREASRHENGIFHISDKKIHPWLKRFDKYFMRPVGSAVAGALTFKELVEDGTIPETWQEDLAAALVMQKPSPISPFAVKEIQEQMVDAYKNDEYFEQQMPFLPQVLFKFLPAIAYHAYKELQENNRGYRLTQQSSVALSSAKRYKGKGYELLSEYEKKNNTKVKSSLVPRRVHDFLFGTPEESSERYEKDLKYLETKPFSDEHSKKLKESFLYRGALRSTMSLAAQKIGISLARKLVEKVGRKKIRELQEKSLGTLSPYLFVPLCYGLAEVALHWGSQKVYEHRHDNEFVGKIAEHVMPLYDKYDLGIGSHEKIKFIKEEGGKKKIKDVHGFRESGYGSYMARLLGKRVLYNFGSYVLPSLVYKFLNNRREIKRWFGEKCRNVGEIFVKIGLCKQNPVDRVQGVFSGKVKSFVKDHPGILLMLADQFIVHATYKEYEALGIMMQGDVEAGMEQMKKNAPLSKEKNTVEDSKKKIIELLKRLEYMRKRELITRNEPQYKEVEKQVADGFNEMYEILARHNMIEEQLDTLFLSGVNLVLPWLSDPDRGGRWAQGVGSYVAQKGKDLVSKVTG